MPENNSTSVLPPATAVRLSWARTGSFTNDPNSQMAAQMAEQAVKDLKARSESNDPEKEYVANAVAAMDASIRNLEIVYKGRNLNFEENSKLRKSYLESINESIQFGTKAKDFVKSLPAMAVTTAGGVTLLDIIKDNGWNEPTLWGFGIALAGVGYLINLGAVRYARLKTQEHYVRQDYERDLYYQQYINRSKSILLGLYKDIERIHRKHFGAYYEDVDQAAEVVNDVLKGVHTTSCPYVHLHMSQGIISPKLWPMCEAGVGEAVRNCEFWEREPS